MKSAKRRLSILCGIVLMIACLVVPVLAITYCFDYVLYRVDGADHDGTYYLTLNAELDKHNYAPAVSYDSSNAPDVQRAVNDLQPGDVVFIGTDHVGIVNNGGLIDHYLQARDMKDQGKPVDIMSLKSDPIYRFTGRLNLDDNLPNMLDAHIQKGLPIYVRHSPGYTPSPSGIMTADISGYTSCPSGQTNCNGNCVDTSSDSQNCGSCGNACAQGESCVSGSCSPSSETTPSTTQDKYAVFLLTNIAGGSIWVGSEQEIQTKPVCSFPGGGLCKNDGTDALVQYVKESQDFASYDDAQAAYCAAPKSNVRSLPLTGGTKANIFGGDYWIDTAPSCPSG
jgi:hypothetical protein